MEAVLKKLIVILFALGTINAEAICDLTSPDIRTMVESYMQTRVSGDLKKAFWMNAFKSEGYSVFSIQFKTQNATTKDDQVTTHMVSVSCSPVGTAMIDSDLGWTVALKYLNPID